MKLVAIIGVCPIVDDQLRAFPFIFATTRNRTGRAAGMMAVPYLAAFYVTRVFLPAMLKRGSGRCVFVTSAASRLVWPGAAGYTAARRALCGLFEAVRGETAGTGVGATMVTFAKVRSDYWANNPDSEERVPKAQAGIPVLSVEQAARAILKGLEMDKEEIIEPAALRLVLTWNHWFRAASRKMMLQPSRQRRGR